MSYEHIKEDAQLKEGARERERGGVGKELEFRCLGLAFYVEHNDPLAIKLLAEH